MNKKNGKSVIMSIIAPMTSTQYGNHTGYDAMQYQEMHSPHVDFGMGAPKGDNNRGNKSPRQGYEGYFTVNGKGY